MKAIRYINNSSIEQIKEYFPKYKPTWLIGEYDDIETVQDEDPYMVKIPYKTDIVLLKGDWLVGIEGEWFSLSDKLFTNLYDKYVSTLKLLHEQAE